MDAMDLTQETFVRMLGAPTATKIACPQGYLRRIARNLLFDRAKNPSQPQSLGIEHDIAVRAEQEDGIRYLDLARRYREAVADLTPRTREVFLLHRVRERTYAQIAALLGITVSTVEYHMARAIVAIGESLEQG